MYQIFTDDVLGSGQFGVVYRGERGSYASGRLFCPCASASTVGNSHQGMFCFLRYSQEVGSSRRSQSHRQDALPHQRGKSSEE